MYLVCVVVGFVVLGEIMYVVEYYVVVVEGYYM